MTALRTSLLFVAIAAGVSAQAPYPESPVIAGLELDWSTHRREAQGADNFQLTWADDNQLYGAWGDGSGFGTVDDARDSLGYSRIEGDWDNYRGYNVWGGKDAENPAQLVGLPGADQRLGRVDQLAESLYRLLGRRAVGACGGEA